jgi:hypothetical protein
VNVLRPVRLLRLLRCRLLLGAAATLAGFVLTCGWGSPAQASPDDARAPADHDCHWEFNSHLSVNGRSGWLVELKCAPGIDPRQVPPEHQPPLAADCQPYLGEVLAGGRLCPDATIGSFCHWELTPRANGRTAQLRCDLGLDPREVPDNLQPPLPVTGCAPGSSSDMRVCPPEGQSELCRWDFTDRPDGHRTATLTCAEGTVPASVPPERRPPLPPSCVMDPTQDPSTPPDQQVPPDLIQITATCAREGMTLIHCRNQDTFAGMDWPNPDTEKDVQIPDDPDLEWWRTEIRLESESAARGDGGQGCTLAERTPPRTCATILEDLRRTAAPQDRDDPDRYDPPGLLPDGCWGVYPAANYSIGANPRLFHLQETVSGWLAGFMFDIGKGAVVTALWLLGWAARLDVRDYTHFASDVAANYKLHIVGPFQLEDAAWLVLMAGNAFLVLRGKTMVALADIGVAIVGIGLSFVLFTHRADYMDSAAALMDETSARLLVAGNTERCLPQESAPRDHENLGRQDCPEGEVLILYDPARTATLSDEIRPLQERFFNYFVEQPYAYLNWGHVPTANCLVASNHVVGLGYYDDGWTSRYMERSGCHEEATYAARTDGDKLFSTFVIMLTDVVSAVGLGFLAVTWGLAKLLLLPLCVLIPFASVFVILPGAMRRVGWQWVGVLVQLTATAFLMAWLVTVVMVGVDRVLRPTEDLDLLERWALILFVVGGGYLGRRRLMAAAQALGTNVTNALTRLSPAAASSPATVAGPHAPGRGLDLAGIDRTGGRLARTAGVGTFIATQGVVTPLTVGALFGAGKLGLSAARVGVVRNAERRVARRTLTNLYEIQLSSRHWEMARQATRGRGRSGGLPMAGLPGLDPRNRSSRHRLLGGIHGVTPVWDRRPWSMIFHPFQVRGERARHVRALQGMDRVVAAQRRLPNTRGWP